MNDAVPDTPDTSPLALARRVKGYIAALVALAQGMLHPHEDAEDRSPRNLMEFGATRTLRTHIQRIEYQLRCYILWLAAQMLERAENEPRYLAHLKNLTSNAKAQMVRALGEEHPSSNQNNTQAQRVRVTALSPFHACGTHAGTNNDDPSPFHACGTETETETETNNNSLIEHQERELRRLTTTKPKIGGFQVLPNFPECPGHACKRASPFTPDPLKLVNAQTLLARLQRLPRILKRADDYAVKLVLSTARSDQAEGGAQATPRQMSSPPWLPRPAKRPLPQDKAKGSGNRVSSLHYPPFSNWLPPETLWASADDETERSDLNLLHHLASSALIRAGHGPPDDPGDDLPDLSALDPPPPPQIRLLCHP